MDPETLKLKEYPGKKKWGGPRHNWWKFGAKHYWENVATVKTTFFRGIPFNEENEEHTALIEEAALLHWGIKGEVRARSDIPDEINEEEATRQMRQGPGERDIVMNGRELND